MKTDELNFSLKEIAKIVSGTLTRHGIGKVAVNGVTASSREVKAGSIFVAVKGTAADGHNFIEEAFLQGAAAAVVMDPAKLGSYPGVVVRDTRRALSLLAALFCGNPSAALKVIGITGTNGKTTTHWLLYHLLNALDCPCVRIGTLGVQCARGIDLPGALTTPSALQIQEIMKGALELGACSAVMEVSSHALDQKRAEDVEFDAAVFTNLTRDHLDYHGEMENYFGAKEHLFELLSSGAKNTRAAVINMDTEYGKRLASRLESWRLNNFSFGRDPLAMVRIVDFSGSAAASALTLQYRGERFEIRSKFIGDHNAENLAGAFSAAIGLGYDPQKAAFLLGQVPQVPGRLEAVGREDLPVFVDYAHTPDALERALGCLRGISPKQLWVVFGCGGDRDRGKRPQMAEIAARLADRVVVTSDNPRTEDPEKIIADILSGPSAGRIRQEGIIEPDRRLAIKKTLENAKPNDVILIAGKGHEDYQIIGKERHHFSDQEEVRKILGFR